MSKAEETECDANAAQCVCELDRVALNGKPCEEWTYRVSHIIRTMAETDHHGGYKHKGAIDFENDSLLCREHDFF